MSDKADQDVQKLFKRWRSGDPAAGQVMAQRFSDWYYAITTVRLGDARGRGPLERACNSFAQGIVGVSKSSELVDWAHGLVAKELADAGSRVEGGDFPNALTNDRSPTELLRQVGSKMSPDQIRLLNYAYGHTADLETLTAEAEAQGGMPLSLLQARYALKRHLRDSAHVPLSVAPEEPNLDLAPLPLYEAGRMETEEEEGFFEQWLISDLVLCQDVAEFATFSHALRAGALTNVSGTSAPTGSAELPAPTKSSGAGNKIFMLLGFIVALGVLAVLVVGIALIFMS